MLYFDKILVPTDFYPGSETALDYAKELARSMNSKIFVIHVIEPSGYPSDITYTSNCFIELESELIKKAKSELASIAKSLADAGIDCETEYQFGRASEQIVDFAEKNQIGLIIIATHGRKGLDHLIFGSTTERVLRKAACPVLAVRIK